MIFKVVDIGSNSVKASLFRLTEHDFHCLEKFRLPLALGNDVFSQKKISLASIDRVIRFIKALPKQFRKQAVHHSIIVATSAVRSSSNRDYFVKRIENATGLAVQVLNGKEESYLIHMGVMSRLPPAPNQILLNIDIGGGSMELSWSRDHEYLKGYSFPLGAIRVSRQMNQSSKGETISSKKIRDTVEKSISQALNGDILKQNRAFGSSGNIKALAKMVEKIRSPLFRKQALDISAGSLEDLIRFCIGKSPAEIEKNFEIGIQRAGIILPAALILLHTLRFMQIEGLQVCQQSLREGVVYFWLKRGHLSFPTLLQKAVS